MKTKNIIQRLCLFLFVLVLAAPAWATNYGCFTRVVFRSRDLGKHQKVTSLRKENVEIIFSDCKTTGGTGSGAIYELAKGSHITVKANDGYAIRWIILRDTEGGKKYSDPEGIKRISSVTGGYKYYFERNAISNSGVIGGNKDDLNDDDNNIVVYQYDASAQSVDIYTHNNPSWGQFKVRDIIVGYVWAPKVSFDQDRYDIYYTSIPNFKPDCDFGGHDGDVWYKVDNTNIATVDDGGQVTFRRPGTVVLTATCDASKNCAKAQCSTTVNMMRDRVTFTAEGLPDVIFSNDSYNLREYLKRKAQSGRDFDQYNSGFSVTSSNNAVLRYDDHWLKFGGTAGEATITLKQEQNNYYEATTFSHTIIVARRDQYGTILIKDANEWKVFCKLVNEKGMTNLNARLEADIDLGGDIAMVGHWPNVYTGTFDGQNHTLTMNWDAGAQKQIAPFRIVKDATITNLRTRGQITSSGYFLSGLINDVYGGKNSVSNCVSEVNITSSYNEGSSDVAGMAAYIYSGSVVTFDDCIVKGTLKATTNKGKKAVSGFVHGQHGTCTLTNCLYIGDNNATGGNTFAPNATINNCYYLNACGSEYKQGTKVTAEQLRNGEVAYNLQNGRNNTVWGQVLGTNDEPLLTADGAKRVRKVEFTYNSRVKATRYATHGKAIYGSMPTFTPKDLLGSDYNEHHYYSGIVFEGGFNGSTTVNTDRTVTVTFNKKDYYEIASKENWKEFCDLVNGGQNAVDAKMTRNIDLGSEINMVAYDTKYSGTFDGQNHTLKLDWNNTNGTLAPFFKVENAIIRNLRTEGNIKSSYSNLSGLILTVSGKTTVKGCVSNVNITYTGNRECYSAGMTLSITYGAVVTFTDCIVKGKYNTTLEEGAFHISGFVLNQNGTCTFNNCLYLGNNVPGGGFTFAFPLYDRVTLNNCYYLNACGTAQGTKITAEQLKNGEVTKKLQNNRTDKCYWAQQLGEMPDFYNAADKSKANYVYYDAAKKGWTCDDFRLTDGTAMPIGLDFTAANVTYERNFTGAQKATLCLPYDLYAQGFKAYTLSGGNKNEVHFKEVDDKLPAYTPYYITANGMPQLGGRNIEVKAYNADKMTTPAAGYKFTGTVAGVSNATAAADNAYILQDDGKFHKVTTTNSAATIPAYRAYIICPPQASGAKQLSVVLDGETTGIGDVTNEATDGKNGPVYDLQGRRVADRLDDARHRLPAGVYIVGGRKVVVK